MNVFKKSLIHGKIYANYKKILTGKLQKNRITKHKHYISSAKAYKLGGTSF